MIEASIITKEELEGSQPIACPLGCGCPVGYLLADGRVVIKVRHNGKSHYVVFGEAAEVVTAGDGGDVRLLGGGPAVTRSLTFNDWTRQEKEPQESE